MGFFAKDTGHSPGGRTKGARRALRNAAIAFIAHGCFALSVLVLDRRPGGTNIGGWDLLRVLHTADFPVYWVIYYVLQHTPLVPLEWFVPHFELAYFVNIALVYIVVGGAFYAALAASVTVWLRYIRTGRTPSAVT